MYNVQKFESCNHTNSNDLNSQNKNCLQKSHKNKLRKQKTKAKTNNCTVLVNNHVV